MTDAGSKPAKKAGAAFRAYYALAALVLGILAGIFANGLGGGTRDNALGVASFVGTLWLNGLKMTVIPLVVALLIVGIAKSAEAAQAGRIAGKDASDERVEMATVCGAKRPRAKVAMFNRPPIAASG